MIGLAPHGDLQFRVWFVLLHEVSPRKVFVMYDMIAWMGFGLIGFTSFPCAFWHDDIRVMAIAHGRKAESLVFCGLVGIMDPPRTSAITFAETMQVCARRSRETLAYNVPRAWKYTIFARTHIRYS